MTAATTVKPLALLYGDNGSSLGSAAAQALLETRQWHKFILGPEAAAEDLSVPADYATQLREHGLFRLPFDEVVVQLGPADVLEMLDHPHSDVVLTFLVATIQQKDRAIEGRLFHTNTDRVAISSYGKIILPLNGDLTEWVNDSSTATFMPDFLPDLQFADEHARVQKHLFLLTTFVFVGLINAEGIVQEHHRAPKFINKKREAKGKLPLFEYHLLKISPALKMPGHVTAGGTHASPRLHWRRGHIRCLPSGAHTQVRPCLVGNKSLGEIEKDYLLRSEASP